MFFRMIEEERHGYAMERFYVATRRVPIDDFTISKDSGRASPQGLYILWISRPGPGSRPDSKSWPTVTTTRRSSFTRRRCPIPSAVRLSTCSTICPFQNRPLVSILKNIQVVMQVFFSQAFEGCFDLFIDDLEGVSRPMELVAADFMECSVEEIVRTLFRVIRTERTDKLSEKVPVSTPSECAAFCHTVQRPELRCIKTYESTAIRSTPHPHPSEKINSWKRNHLPSHVPAI
jgi:hypothetical protein